MEEDQVQMVWVKGNKHIFGARDLTFFTARRPPPIFCPLNFLVGKLCSCMEANVDVFVF
jgi:hypothetical protein